ncbi:MAG: transcription antitermination factor NusB [Anaerolineae bacterium]
MRHQARIVALQVLYELDTTAHQADRAIAYRLEEEPLPQEGESFLRQLVSGVVTQRDRLDALIQKYAPAWPVQQIAVIDRNILRIALFELSGVTGTPTKVAINEAVELAKMFGSDSSSRFVNGVLGTAVADQAPIALVAAQQTTPAKD